MGYRSDVHYELCFETEDKLRNFVAVALLMPDKFEGSYVATYKDALEACEFDAESHRIVFNTCSKWYEEFSDVQMHTALIALAHDQFDASTVFIRLGEEDADIEEERQAAGWDGGESTWDTYVERSIHTSIYNGSTFDEFTTTGVKDGK